MDARMQGRPRSAGAPTAVLAVDMDPEKSAASNKSPAESASGHHEAAGVRPPAAADKLRRSLSPRQVQMIAIGGTIG